MLKSAYIDDILEGSAHPEEDEEPYQEVCETGHVLRTLSDQNTVQILARGYLMIVDTREKKNAEADHEGESPMFC